jgi:NADPH:quinone reductase-like Zn-dependent oxidoreductase
VADATAVLLQFHGIVKAWIKRGDGLRFEEVPSPTPASDEMLIRVSAISLNRGELRGVSHAMDGAIPGWDIAGTVAVKAPNGNGPAEGTRVAALVPGPGLG